MNLAKWEKGYPWHELDGLRKELERLFGIGDPESKEWLAANSFAPATDVSETDTDVLVRCNLPGIKTEDIGIDIHENVLTIKGEKKGEKEMKEKHFHRKETWEGKFQRSFTLPVTVDQAKINAVLKDGVLTIKLPKTQPTESRKITIKS